jgi:hypothetical protein
MTSVSTGARRGLSHAWFTSSLPAWPRLVAALAIAAAAWVVWAPALRTIFRPTSDNVGWVHESFNEGFVNPGAGVEVSGFTPCTDGWCLGPNSSGTLVYRFNSQFEVPFLNLWFYAPPQGTSQLSVSVNRGASYQGVSGNSSLAAATVDLGIRVSRGQEVWLKFDATNPTANQVLVVDEIKILYRPESAPRLPSSWTAFAIVVSFGLAIVVLCRRWPLALSTLLILAAGAALRYDAAAALASNALDPDAITYRMYAALMHPFTETGVFSARFGVREPLYILAVWTYATLFGGSDFGLRLMTVIFSTACVWAGLRLGRRLFGDAAGQVIGLVIALNGVLIAEAARGLRLEFEIVLAMAYYALAFTRTWPKVIPAAVVLSLLGGLLVLTRSTYLPVFLVLNTYALYRPGLAGFKSWAVGVIISIVIVVGMVAPYRYQMYKNHGDAFYDGAIYARWLANAEFAGRPGFPTVAELQKDSVVGPPITYREYLFGLHTLTEVFTGMARGSWKLFRQMLVCPLGRWPMSPACANVNAVFQALAAFGLIAALFIRRYRWIPLAVVALGLPVSFLYDRGLVELHRHTYSAYPLVLFAAVLTVVLAWQAVTERRFTRAVLQPDAR